MVFLKISMDGFLDKFLDKLMEKSLEEFLKEYFFILEKKYGNNSKTIHCKGMVSEIS